MRKAFEPQLELGATPIELIKFNPRSRDDIPQLLRGLQFIYNSPALRDSVFEVLERGIGANVSFKNGRPGMDMWVLLVLGTLRLGLNCNYDRLQDLANEHKTIRAMLGHGGWEDEFSYGLQTLRDNVGLLTESMLQEINTIVVKAGHKLVKKNSEEMLAGRCDSYVVETHVEYPTDTGMLWDSIRRSIALISALCRQHGARGWRQAAYNIQRIKRYWTKARKSNRSGKADASQKKKEAHKAFLNEVSKYVTAHALHEVFSTTKLFCSCYFQCIFILMLLLLLDQIPC